MKKILVVLVALIAMVGMCAATPDRVAKKLPAPNVTILNADSKLPEDSIDTSIPGKEYIIGIDTGKYYGGIDDAIRDENGYVIMVHYNENGYWEGLFPQDEFWGGHIEHELGFTSNIPWEGSMSDWQTLPAFQAWADNRELGAHGFHVTDGHIYDENGREYVYRSGAPTEGAEVGENPSSNPALPGPEDAVAYTTMDFCDPA